jgi:hypothetical protein
MQHYGWIVNRRPQLPRWYTMLYLRLGSVCVTVLILVTKWRAEQFSIQYILMINYPALLVAVFVTMEPPFIACNPIDRIGIEFVKWNEANNLNQLFCARAINTRGDRRWWIPDPDTCILYRFISKTHFRLLYPEHNEPICVLCNILLRWGKHEIQHFRHKTTTNWLIKGTVCWDFNIV